MKGGWGGLRDTEAKAALGPANLGLGEEVNERRGLSSTTPRCLALTPGQ